MALPVLRSASGSRRQRAWTTKVRGDDVLREPGPSDPDRARPSDTITATPSSRHASGGPPSQPSPAARKKRGGGRSGPGRERERTPSEYPARVQTPWKVGAHVSAAGGVENAILNAAKLGYVAAAAGVRSYPLCLH